MKNFDVCMWSKRLLAQISFHFCYTVAALTTLKWLVGAALINNDPSTIVWPVPLGRYGYEVMIGQGFVVIVTFISHFILIGVLMSAGYAIQRFYWSIWTIQELSKAIEKPLETETCAT